MLISIAVGLIAGFLANYIYKGKGAGIFFNLILGVVGSYVGSFLFGFLGITAAGFIGGIVSALGGSLVVLFLWNKFKK